jgi:hypothetical protein
LSEPHTVDAFMTRFDNKQAQNLFKGTYWSYWPRGEYYRDKHQVNLYYYRSKFKFVWGTGTTPEMKYKPTYLVVYYPEDNPDTTDINESITNAEVIKTITWDMLMKISLNLHRD